MHTKNNNPFLRLCENCKQKKNSDTGNFIKYNEGMNQKWFCHHCYDKRNLRGS